MLVENLGEQLVLSTELFARFQKLVYSTCGIDLANSKRTMLSVRLSKRLRVLNIDTFDEYFEFVEKNFAPEELQEFLNVVTTNKTDFYREKHHFEFLTSQIFSTLKYAQKISQHQPFRIWSAGCSTGEEPYTIALELAEVMGAKTGNFEILATDISTKVLREAMKAVYSEESVAPIPDNLKSKYLLRGTGKNAGLYKVAPEITKHIQFGRLNFIDDEFDTPFKMHVIFCRNVLIYFDSETRDRILQKLCDRLLSKGYLLIGHSETIAPMEFGLERISPTVYRKLK